MSLEYEDICSVMPRSNWTVLKDRPVQAATRLMQDASDGCTLPEAKLPSLPSHASRRRQRCYTTSEDAPPIVGGRET